MISRTRDRGPLYLIEILHQTTTYFFRLLTATPLYLIEILHQTTTLRDEWFGVPSCILSKFYIKPQRDQAQHSVRRVVSYRNSTSNHNDVAKSALALRVVSYRNSTSNHNSGTTTPNSALLYLIEILHQTTTLELIIILRFCCILSKFYIKPQLISIPRYRYQCCILSKFYIKPQLPVGTLFFRLGCILSKFYIKPQLTGLRRKPSRSCILSKFYIKPQLWGLVRRPGSRCILSKFYIKPQLSPLTPLPFRVVSYRNSTSNHN